MARLIGTNTREAIDWTQDKLTITRPLAESVVFSMISDRAAIVGDSGIILFEDDELERRSKNKSFDMKNHKKMRFHVMRKHNSRQIKAKKTQYDWNNANQAAQDMIGKEEDAVHEISSGIRLIISLDEQDILNRLEKNETNFDERDLEVIRLMVARGLLYRVKQKDEILYKINSSKDIWNGIR